MTHKQLCEPRAPGDGVQGLVRQLFGGYKFVFVCVRCYS